MHAHDSLHVHLHEWCADAYGHHSLMVLLDGFVPACMNTHTHMRTYCSHRCFTARLCTVGSYPVGQPCRDRGHAELAHDDGRPLHGRLCAVLVTVSGLQHLCNGACDKPLRSHLHTALAQMHTHSTCARAHTHTHTLQLCEGNCSELVRAHIQ